MLTLAITQKWKARTAADPNFRIYQMGSSVNALNDSLTPNAVFEHDVSLSHLQNGLVKTLPYPETLTVLVVDDENEIGQMICEYLSCQSAPSFKTAYCENGSLAISYLKKTTPDVLVMDVKMPVMTGIEAYAIICRTWPRLPVIIFFDAVFGDEIEKLQEIGRPAMIEKGGRQSEMPQLLATIKKKAFFR